MGIILRMGHPPIQFVCQHHLMYERAGVDDATKSIEVVEERRRIIHNKTHPRKFLLSWGEIVCSADNKMRKDISKVVLLFSLPYRTCAWRDAVNQ